jgi:hypothetical protein
MNATSVYGLKLLVYNILRPHTLLAEGLKGPSQELAYTYYVYICIYMYIYTYAAGNKGVVRVRSLAAHGPAY